MAEATESEEKKQEIGDRIDLTTYSVVKLHPLLEKNEFPGEALTGSKSLLAKHLTREVFEKLKDLKTTDKGFTLARAINTGVLNPDSCVGIHAGDIESYSLFAPLFDPIIEEYHGGFKATDKHPMEAMDASKLVGDLSHASKAAIRSTRIRVARNIAGFALACGQNEVSEKLAIERLMKKVLGSLKGDLRGTYYPLEGMSETDRLRLVEDHFLFKGKDKKQADSGYHMWWPKGRGIFHNEAKTFLLWINEGDHMRIISMQKDGDVRATFERLANGVTAIECGLRKLGHEFMRTEHLGHISNCPTNLGTGLRGGVHMALPTLAKGGVEGALQSTALSHKLQARGIHGEHSESEGGVVDLSNKFRLGFSEVQLVQFMIDGVNALVDLEQKTAAADSTEAA